LLGSLVWSGISCACCAVGLLILLDSLSYLAGSFQIFNKQHLVAINFHLVGWAMQFVAKLNQRKLGCGVGGGAVGSGGCRSSATS
jgi:hypothetical protein